MRAFAFNWMFLTDCWVFQVFTNPEAVMAKLILNIYNGILKKEVDANLGEVKYTEAYLKNLHDWCVAKDNKLMTDSLEHVGNLNGLILIYG